MYIVVNLKGFKRPSLYGVRQLQTIISNKKCTVVGNIVGNRGGYILLLCDCYVTVTVTITHVRIYLPPTPSHN